MTKPEKTTGRMPNAALMKQVQQRFPENDEVIDLEDLAKR
jgi:hypothetical protein